MIDRVTALQREATAKSDASLRPAEPASPLQYEILELVGPALRGVERWIERATRSRYPVVDELSRRGAAMGGKRLRPTLLLLSAQAVGEIKESSPDRQLDLQRMAAAIELVHAASLVHDDVMDAAARRRHQPTLAAVAGNSAAVLLGDFLFTRAYALAANCRSSRPARELAAASTRLCEGELCQQMAVKDWDLSMRDYRRMLVLKTGSLCAVSCRLGAWGMGTNAAQRRLFGRFGNLLGLAFQVYDDWLDYWGTAEVGKTLGTDFAQAKPTLPLLRYLSTTTAHERRQLIEHLEQDDREAIAGIFRKIQHSDSGDYTLRIAKQLADRAQALLSGLPVSPAREALHAVAAYSICRRM